MAVTVKMILHYGKIYSRDTGIIIISSSISIIMNWIDVVKFHIPHSGGGGVHSVVAVMIVLIVTVVSYNGGWFEWQQRRGGYPCDR